jgi:O-antigen/teichoic acid export membrane protein
MPSAHSFQLTHHRRLTRHRQELPLSALPPSTETDLPSGDAQQLASAVEARATWGRYLLLLFADVGCRGLRFVADIVLVRHFNPETIGQLNLSQSLAVQGMGLSTCGLDTAGTRAVAAGTVAPARMAATVVMLRLVLGMIAWGIVTGLALLVPKYHAIFQLTALYGLSIITGALTIGWVAQARNRMHVVALAAIATHLGYFGGVELTAHAGWPPVAVPLLLALSEGLTAAALWGWLLLTCGPMSGGLPRPDALRFLRDSLPIGGATYLRMLTIGSDVLLLGLFVGDAEVGLYSTGFKLYSLGISLIALYLTVLLPQLATVAAHDPRSVTAATNVALRRALLAAAVATPLAMFFAENVLQLLFGAPFAAAARPVQILFLAWPAHLIAGHFRTALLALGRQGQDLRLVVAAALAHVAAKLCLIPWLGINGAAWGTLAGEIVLMLLAWQSCNAISRHLSSHRS